MLSLLDVPDHPIAMRSGDERTHPRVAVQRVAEPDGLGLGHDRVEKLRMDRFLDEDARPGRAHLALVHEHPEHRAFDGRLPVRVREEDVRGLAAQLERDALQVRVGGGVQDGATGARRTGEGDLVDEVAFGQERPHHRTITCDHVDHALGQVRDAVQNAGERKSRHRCGLGRLQHHGAPRAQRRRDLPGGHQQRVVPGDDLPADADRLFQRQAERLVGNRVDLAGDLGGEAPVVLEAGRRVGHVELGLDDRLAHVLGLESRELGEDSRSRRAISSSTCPRLVAVRPDHAPESKASRAA